MDIYYTIEEKYLKAIQDLGEGDIPKAKLSLEQILEDEPGFGKAHYYLACIYFDKLVNYPLALQHIELALKFDPQFPEAHQYYLGMLLDLDCHSQLLEQSQKALKAVGVCKSCVYRIVALSYEKRKQWDLALDNFRQAYLHSINKYEIAHIEECAERVKAKKKSEKKWVYQVG